MTPPDISNAEGLSAGPTVPSFSRMLSSSELRKMSVRWPTWKVPLPVPVAGLATVISSSNSPKESCAVRRTMDSFTSRETSRRSDRHGILDPGLLGHFRDVDQHAILDGMLPGVAVNHIPEYGVFVSH